MTKQPENHGLAELWRRQRFTVLLLVLVIDILIAPAVGTIEAPGRPHLGEAVMLLSLTALVFAALLATSERKTTQRAALGIGLVTVVFAWLDLATDQLLVFALGQAFEAVFLALVIVLLVRHVFRERRVTFDIISASLCAYLLLGLAWTTCYSLIEIWQPDSFRMPEDGFAAFSGQDIDASVRRVYFSFVTLLTLGYGDVVPVGSIARMSAVMEAFAGQVFLVVLIARLVGIHVGQAMSTPPSESNPS